MPNPVRRLKRTDRLKPRQKAIVKRLRSSGMPVMVYRRKSNTNRLSVHNPFLDVVRKTRSKAVKKNTKIPHARDTSMQKASFGGRGKERTKRTKKRTMASRRRGKIKRRGILFP